MYKVSEVSDQVSLRYAFFKTCIFQTVPTTVKNRDVVPNPFSFGRRVHILNLQNGLGKSKRNLFTENYMIFFRKRFGSDVLKPFWEFSICTHRPNQKSFRTTHVFLRDVKAPKD
jgi:hypothetical protein